MDTVIKGIKTKNKVIVGEDHLDQLATAITGSEREGMVGILDLTTIKRMKKSRPSILSLEFNDVARIEHFIITLKKLRKKMLKAGVPHSRISSSEQARLSKNTIPGDIVQQLSEAMDAILDELRKDKLRRETRETKKEEKKPEPVTTH